MGKTALEPVLELNELEVVTISVASLNITGFGPDEFGYAIEEFRTKINYNAFNPYQLAFVHLVNKVREVNKESTLDAILTSFKLLAASTLGSTLNSKFILLSAHLIAQDEVDSIGRALITKTYACIFKSHEA